MMRIRAYHEPSGSVLNGEVTDVLYEKGYEPSYRVIPDGLLESVIVRSGTWRVLEIRDKVTA
jgi:hypothetical protein